ncbi:MAG: hypothetical protein VXW60_04550, partial [Bacteroidota bacterium]|nr:hypothetical protein [Bacteroidota bacterium]
MITKLFRFYVLSSTHIGLAVLSLLAIVHLQYDLSWQYPLFIFVFCATVVTYNFMRSFSFSEHVKPRRPILVFSFLTFIGLCISATKLTFHTLLLASFLGLLSFSYVLPINRFFTGLRQLPYLKSFVVVGCWASVVVLIPLINHRSQLSTKSIILWFQMALWTFATMIPFEIRDSYGDSNRMKTIAQIFEIKELKMIGTLSLIAVVILSYFLINEIEDMTPTVLTAAIATVLLRKSSQEQSPYFASFWVESLPIIWL